jgi:hypothetical protein
MTGGYGNSYAASVGNQAYQAQLNNLNDIIPELYQMAYNKYNQEGQDMLNKMALLGDERNFEYGKWGDGYNRLVADRDYTAGQYDSEWGRDYGMYESDRNLAQGEHTNQEGYNYQNYRDAIADEQWQKNYELSARELAMAEEAWEAEKASKGVSYDEDGKVVVSSGGDGGSNDLSGIETKAQSYTNNNDLANYLNGLANSAVITKTEADSLYAKYKTPDQVALNQRSWHIKEGDDGGINWFGGVDNNAKLTDQYGNTYKASKLVDALVESGISKKDAKKYVESVLASLGD